MKARRQILRMLALSPLVLYSSVALPARQIPPVEQLKAGYRRRLTEKLGKNAVPYIDIESSCNPGQLDIDGVASAMDALDIGLMALSADVGGGQFARGIRYDALASRLVEKYPDRFIPVGNGGGPPAWTRDCEEASGKASASSSASASQSS